MSDIAAMREKLDDRKELRWGVFLEDTYLFGVTMLALLASGKTPVVLPNVQEFFIHTISADLDGLICEKTMRGTNLPQLKVLSDISTGGRDSDKLELDAQRSGIVLFTSGSTGQPKRIPKSLLQLETEVEVLEGLWGNSLTDAVIVSTVTHQHIYGLLFRFLWPLVSGRCFDSITYNDPWAVVRQAERFARIGLISSPAQLTRLPDLADLSSLSANLAMVFSSGGPLPQPSAETLRERLGRGVCEVLGSTETGGIAFRFQVDGNADTPWKPLPLVRIKCAPVDNSLMIHSPFEGSGQWYRTADMAEFLSEDTFVLKGRTDNIVKVGDKRLSLTELEQRLLASSLVDQAAAAVQDTQRARVVVAIVLSEKGRHFLQLNNKRKLDQHLRRDLLNYFEPVVLPKTFRYVEKLPFNSQGKLPRSAIIELFAPTHKGSHRLAGSASQFLKRKEGNLVTAIERLNGDVTISETDGCMQGSVTFGDGRITIADILSIANANKSAMLSPQTAFRDKIKKGAALVEGLVMDNAVVYGITTGYGDSCTVKIPADLVDELPVHLIHFHGCGIGKYFDLPTSRAILAACLTSLAQGYSGVRLELLHQITEFMNRGIIPVIPEEGSVGASGDLTPLSYVAAALMGERKVYYLGEIHDTGDVLRQARLSPIKLRPKESLAIMNGTRVMTAIACMAYSRAEYLTRLTSRITGLAVVALKGNVDHFDEFLFSLKPHPGQMKVAGWIRRDLQHYKHSVPDRIQDPYSIRCAPHVIGVLQDALPWMADTIENELNSVNDNPVIDGIGERVLHGGHFYGGHIAFAMDSLKNAVANLADLMDRQLALLVDVKYNHGLPSNLSGSRSERRMINHGFKAVQIAVSAWTAEALKTAMPMSVFSRSTECHNQDKVSLGTIAARDCIRVLQLTEQVAAAVLLASMQAIELRIRNHQLDDRSLSPDVVSMKGAVFSHFELIEEDRPMDVSLSDFVKRIQDREWKLYE